MRHLVVVFDRSETAGRTVNEKVGSFGSCRFNKLNAHVGSFGAKLYDETLAGEQLRFV